MAAAQGDETRAARLLGAVRSLEEVIHSDVEVGASPDDARLLTVARTHVGDERSLEAWTAGRAMTLDDAIEYALASIN